MKVKIETPIARLTVDLSEDQVADILGLALDYATGMCSIPEKEAPVCTPEEPIGEEYINTPEKRQYKGFLFLKCESCGKFKGFMPKKPITYYHCDCGHDTDLNDLVEIYAQCECGETFKYLTNAYDPILTFDCIKCGYPINVEYSEKNGVYKTLK